MDSISRPAGSTFPIFSELYDKENTMDEEYLNDKEAMTFRKRQVTVVVIIVGALLVYRLWRQLFIKRWN